VIVGTARPEDLASSRPRIARFPDQPLVLRDVTVLQAMFEMPVSAREAVVPPALHPTNPAVLVLQAWRCGESPWGPFALVQARAQTRSGLRPRGFVLGAACDGRDAADALATDYGYPALPADISLRRSYDGVWLRVSRGEEEILSLEGANPEPLDPRDLQYSGTLNLAETPRGLRLVQIEPELAVHRAERVRPRLRRFDAAAWGDSRLDPYHPISASIATADVTLPPVRFVCRPDVIAFTGTERV
jgi:hypothetical protein